ncbi:hypothetical protein [Kutzneria sp. 744]|uniref:hypothetical protein n=1 Tax=Kutzneria sp. (strain 744) TaxID=345341 RepID=UPI0003EED08F|nr:hypothetical protein [Kutzneria sp. 744]EWM09798.1 hypothetical protein KUTG_00102 [Kutzneria sp. 744]
MADTRIPVVDAWLTAGDMGPAGPQMQMDQLDGMHMVAERNAEPCPDEILEYWRLLLATRRLRAVQNEHVFIAQALRSGWSWNRVAGALGLPDVAAAQQRQAFLAAEMIRCHPSHDARPWRL